MKQTDYLEVEVLKAAFRTQVWVVRANTTAYALGDRVFAATFDGNIYECVAAGTSAGSPPTFNTNLGDTTTDGSVTWLTLKLGMPKRPMYFALFTAAPTDAGGGTEVTGGSYARVAYQPTDSNWNTPNVAGNTSNKLAITFPSPTGNWGNVSYVGIFDRLTNGNLLWYGPLTDAIDVLNGDPAPSFPIGAFHILGGQRRSPGLRTTTP